VPMLLVVCYKYMENVQWLVYWNHLFCRKVSFINDSHCRFLVVGKCMKQLGCICCVLYFYCWLHLLCALFLLLAASVVYFISTVGCICCVLHEVYIYHLIRYQEPVVSIGTSLKEGCC
jgi:hypothetical protein